MVGLRVQVKAFPARCALKAIAKQIVPGIAFCKLCEGDAGNGIRINDLRQRVVKDVLPCDSNGVSEFVWSFDGHTHTKITALFARHVSCLTSQFSGR